MAQKHYVPKIAEKQEQDAAPPTPTEALIRELAREATRPLPEFPPRTHGEALFSEPCGTPAKQHGGPLASEPCSAGESSSAEGGEAAMGPQHRTGSTDGTRWGRGDGIFRMKGASPAFNVRPGDRIMF
ncbi:hypothetical protein T484DRAFT_1988990 [Baffinella frigidus]|nr:hypothetical protein T484DRAFT_1988990 [Cryptophyta sp. CCMP2293]